MAEARDVITGTIVEYSNDRGFGFIESDERRPDNRDYFFHIKSYRDVGRDREGNLALCERKKNIREPIVGQRVVFYPFDDEKGPAASLWTYEFLWEQRLSPAETEPNATT